MATAEGGLNALAPNVAAHGGTEEQPERILAEAKPWSGCRLAANRRFEA
jgi:hypothetical protein